MTTVEDQLRAQSDATIQEADTCDQRRKIVRSVAHSSAVESMPLDAQTMTTFERYVNGTPTTEQMRETVLKQYPH